MKLRANFSAQRGKRKTPRERLLVADGFLVAILAPGEPDDQQIKKSDEQKSDGMGVHEAMHLIDAENTEDTYCGGIGPKRVEPQRSNQDGFDEPVRQQIDRSEMLAAVGEMLGGAIEMSDDEFVPVKRQIQFQEFQRNMTQSRWLYEPKNGAADRFQDAVDAFQSNGGAKTIMQQHFAPACGWSVREGSRLNS